MSSAEHPENREDLGMRVRLLSLVRTLDGIPEPLIQDQVIMIEAGEYAVSLEILLEQVDDWDVEIDGGQVEEFLDLCHVLGVRPVGSVAKAQECGRSRDQR